LKKVIIKSLLYIWLQKSLNINSFLDRIRFGTGFKNFCGYGIRIISVVDPNPKESEGFNGKECLNKFVFFDWKGRCEND
jgi:hypothetical protein